MSGFLPILAAADLLIRLAITARVLLRGTSRPSVTLAWVVVLLTLPVVGIVAYALIGEAWFGRRRAKRHAQVLAMLDRPEHHGHADPAARVPGLPRVDAQLAELAHSVSHAEPTTGNLARLTGDSEEAIRWLCADIDAAREHVHLVTYIYLEDRAGTAVADALSRASGRGVRCRVLLDGHGSAALLRSATARGLRASGVQVVEALPVHPLRRLFTRMDLRNHRKMAIIDGAIAHAGSMNIASKEFAPEPRFAPWVDCWVRTEGPVAREVQLVFLEDWYFETGESLQPLLDLHPPLHPAGGPAQFVASGPNFDNDAMSQLVLACLQVAEREIVLTTPYFVPNIETVTAMCVAARRGVRVHLVVPARNNSRLVALASRSFYGPLLRSGVSIHEFRGGLLHAKTVTVDERVALVTSANLDRRSFDLNFEASMLLYDDSFAVALRRLQREYMHSSTALDAAAWRRRGPATRLVENIAGLLSPLL